MTTQPTQADKAAAFRALHEGDPFVIPNPWDAGSAKALASLGFAALATTSSGFAFTLGRDDGGVDARRRGRARRGCSTPPPRSPSPSTSRTVTVPRPPMPPRRSSAPPRREPSAARSRTSTPTPASMSSPPRLSGSAPQSTPRAASASRSRSPLGPRTTSAAIPTSTTRSPACAPTRRPGADVLYAPGLRTTEEIAAVCEAVSKPVNVLARPKLSLAEIAAAGATRISLGGSLAWVAIAAMAATAIEIRDRGDFSSIAVPIRVDELL